MAGTLFLNYMNFDFTCTASRIIMDLPHLIWEAESADPQGQIFITRMFHNKVGFLLGNYLRCYLSYFSPEYIASFLTIFGTIFFFFGVYLMILKKSKILPGLLLFPLPALLEFFPVTVRGLILMAGYIIIILAGLYYLYAGRKPKN